MATGSLPGVLLFGRTAGGLNVPVLVDDDGFLAGGGNPFDQLLNTDSAVAFDALTVGGFDFPAVDGNADDVLTTDGAGHWTFQPLGTVELPLQVAADGDPVLLNDGDDVILRINADGVLAVRRPNGADAGLIFENTNGTTAWKWDPDANTLIPGTTATLGSNGDPQRWTLWGSTANVLALITGTSVVDSAQDNLLQVIGGGAAAALTTAFGLDADLTWTATNVGQAGNAIQVEYVDPGMASQSLSASYDSGTKVLTISLATDSTPFPSSATLASSGDGVITVLKTAGTNAGVVDVLNDGGPDASLSAEVDGSDVLVHLGTDGDGNPDPAKNTVTLVTDAIEALSGYTATFSGTDSDAIDVQTSGTFAGGNETYSLITTAQDIIDLGSYDSAPVTVGLAGGGTGIVPAMAPTNLSGGLAALNVTGPSWLDNGAIVTDGSGGASFDGPLSASELHATNGDSGTGTVISAITVVDGIITSITVA